MRAFEYGWGTQGDPYSPFWVRFNRVTREPKGWKEELYAAAREVVAAAGSKPIWVCFSGGIGAEIVCRAFFDQGIRFHVLTIEDPGHINERETAYAVQWCRERGIEQKVLALNIDQFLGTDIVAYSRKPYVTSNVYRYFQIKLLEIVEAMGGYAVIGSGEQTYRVDRTKSELTAEDPYVEFEIGVIAPFEWCKRNATSHQPRFFSSTPELCLSYLNIPIVDFAINHPDIFRHPKNVIPFKRLVYQSIWTDLKFRSKHSGYEKIEEGRSKIHNDLQRTFGPLIQTYKLPLVDLIRQLKGGSEQNYRKSLSGS